jgi:uncharacterized protein
MIPSHTEATSLVAQRLLGRVADFADELRRSGLSVTAEEVASAIEAAHALDLTQPDSLYWGARIAMVRNPEDLVIFDLVFRAFWQGRALPPEESAGDGGRGSGSGDEDAGDHGQAPSDDRRPAVERESPMPGDPPAGSGPGHGAPDARATYSARETLGHKRFEEYDDRDYERLAERLGAIEFGGPWRRSRRKHRGARGPIDVRGTFRAGFRTSGHPVRPVHRTTRSKRRQLTFVCDVSGSMERYSMALLHLADIVRRRRGRVAAFGFATRLTELTRELETHEPVTGAQAAAAKVADWSGGTRMAPCLAELRRDHAEVVRGAAVVLASDGWDLGEPNDLRREMAGIRRLAHTVIWVNPNLQDPRFEPLTQGMAAALPYVDHLLPCHNLDSLGPLFKLLEQA